MMPLASAAMLPMALFVVRVVSPALVLLATLALVPTRSTPPAAPSEIISVVVATRIPRRALILSFLSLAALTYLLDGLAFTIYAVLKKIWPQGTGIEISTVLGLLAFGGMAALGAWKDVRGIDVWSLKRVKLGIAAALVLDIAQVVLFGVAVKIFHNTSISVPTLLHLAFPALRVLLLVPLLYALIYPRVVYTSSPLSECIDSPVANSSSLLLPAAEGVSAFAGLPTVVTKSNQYGTFRSGRSSLSATTGIHTPAPSQLQLPTLKQDSQPKSDISPDPSWAEFCSRIRHIAPYLWPTKNRALQFLAFLCILLLIIGRFVNAASPLVLGGLVHALSDSSKHSPWPYLFAFVGLKFLQGSGGLAALRDTLWAPVMQYSDREMSQLSFDHLLNLSLSWHSQRKTGEVLRILDRGSAMNRTFELLLFNIFPTFFDLAIAVGIFMWKFELSLAVMIFSVMFLYVFASVVLTSWRTTFRRQMNERDIITRGIHTDCLLNFETVKYFNGEQHEGERYRESINAYQTLEFKVVASFNLLNLVQNLIISSGLLVGAMIVALHVTRGELDTSDFIVFITYLSQLYGPLNSLGFIYRSVNQSLVDSEKLLRLLNEPVDVNDKRNAPDLVITGGEIEFDNVTFSYDRRITALNRVSFKVPIGSSVALVGESGSGKSTILRLLYRFYDLQDGEGRILIDGQDIRDVTQSSLRKAIGVVPQDCNLFNETIGYNIGYGKLGSSMEEIISAARSAQMHERIMSFPDGYETKVGERGVRLSGGEKQRVAIARTVLKNPPILLLDEATSALDTSTERDIQKALQNLVHGRSSLSIAHRLCTIVNADIILVLKDGQILEQGSHSELLARGGIFATMWADQISGSEDNNSDVYTKEAVESYSFDLSERPPSEPPSKIEAEAAPLEEMPSSEEAISEAIPEKSDASPDVVETMPQISEVTPDVLMAEALSATQDKGDDMEPEGKNMEPEVEREEIVTAVEAETSDSAALVSAPPEVEEGAADAISAPPQVGDHAGTDPSQPTASFGFPVTKEPLPIAFPVVDETVSQQAPPTAEGSVAQSPVVTFVAGVDSPPSRVGTPDPESEPKRKRISSQNFQRLARKISLSRRQGSSSSIIPILRRDNSSPVPSPGGSFQGAESPTTSVHSDSGKSKLKKKDKKDKKGKGLL